jgi:hypothetical protein
MKKDRGYVRLTINVPHEVHDLLVELSEVMGTSKASVVVGIMSDNKAALQEALRILRMSKGPKLVDALDSLLERSQQDIQTLRSEIQTDEKWKSE